jgi:C_GCAxxG_C_C family probable redox protein
VCQELGIESPVVPRIATAFGGGMGGIGSVCGAVVGAVMAIGLAHGREEPSQSRDQAYALTQQVYRGFQQEMGSTICRDLTGIDLTTPEGVKEIFSSGVAMRVCLRAGSTGYRLALAAVREAQEGNASAD